MNTKKPIAGSILIEEEEQTPKPYEYFAQTQSAKVHHYYLSGYISEPTDYVKMVHEIQTAPPEDTIHIHLNTPGGDLSTGVQIINAMKFSSALVICSLEGEAHSLGSLIFLAADQFVVHDNAFMLIHNYTGGVFGKGKEQELEMEATIRWFAEIANKYYIPFLTDKELKDVFNDKDKWLHSEEIRKRLTKMVRIKKKELKA